VTDGRQATQYLLHSLSDSEGNNDNNNKYNDNEMHGNAKPDGCPLGGQNSGPIFRFL